MRVSPVAWWLTVRQRLSGTRPRLVTSLHHVTDIAAWYQRVKQLTVIGNFFGSLLQKVYFFVFDVFIYYLSGRWIFW